MGLKLITGPANAGKTGYVVRQAIKAAAEGLTPYIVVPTVADTRRLESELAAKAPLGIRVLTFHALVEELWMLHGDGRRPVERAARSALLQRVIAGEAGTPLAAISRTPGFLRFLERAVSISDSETDREMPPTTSAMAQMVDLAAIYQRELAEAGLVEASWMPRMLAERPLTLEGPVLLARFDILTTQQSAFLLGLARQNDVTVTLTWEDALEATRVNDEAIAVLATASSRHEVLVDGERDDELGHVARALFGPPVGLRSEGLVVTGVATGEDGENSLVAASVRRELDRGTPPERLAIVCRHAGRRSRALCAALKAEGVQAQLDVRLSVVATALGRAFSAVLSLALGSGGRSEATALLLGPFCDLGRSRADAMDRRWRTNRVAEPGALMREILETHGSLGGVLSMTKDLTRPRIDEETAIKWQAVLDALLSAHSERRVGEVPGMDQTQDAAAHRAIVDTIGDMAAAAGHPFGAADIAAALPSLQLALSADEVPGAVQVIDVGSIGSRRFDVVILMDLTARGFPVSSRESLETEMARLLGGASASSEARSRILFYSLVSRARNRLYLVRQGCDAEGEPVTASPALDGLLDLYRDADAGPEGVASAPPETIEVPMSEIATFAPVFGAGRREMRAHTDSAHMRTVARGTLTSDAVLKGQRERESFSATEVEVYLQCPYRWFYQRILRPTEIDSEFGGRELGTRAHRYLALFYERLPDDLGLTRVSAAALDESLELFDRVSATEGVKMARASSLEEELMAARALALARQAVVDDASMFHSAKLVEPEVQFEDVPFAGEHFRGRIDRIDLAEDNVFVTDYKASAAVRGYAKFESEGLIQTVVYAIAAERRAERPVAASVYRSLRARRCRGFWRSDLLGSPPERCSDADALGEQAYRELVEQTEGRVAAAVAGMREGRVPRSPKG